MRRASRILNCAAALALIAAIALLAPATAGVRPSGPTLRAILLRWVDGDTLVASIAGSGQTRVRLIGIDAPEASPNPRAADQARRLGVPLDQILALGRAARAQAARLAPPGSTVTLELDVQTHDRYGRLLAYVWAGNVLVNLELVRSGHACPLTIPPNVRYAGAIVQAAREARCW